MEVEGTGSLSAATNAASTEVKVFKKELDNQEVIAQKLLEPVEKQPRSDAHPTGHKIDLAV